MSALTVFAATGDATQLAQATDGVEIAAILAPLGVRFERWPLDHDLPDSAAPEEILNAFRPHLDRLMGQNGAGSADVVQMRGAPENYPVMRKKFLDEHTHAEDEVRFFVSGSGVFTLHIGDRVYAARCEAGDLISVPAGAKHWFDAGDNPHFTVLRIFTDRSGWTPIYTGDSIAERFAVPA
jgi:1,2-dihydroxy-3-keto-5-methylthiopentene dioxygenase